MEDNIVMEVWLVSYCDWDQHMIFSSLDSALYFVGQELEDSERTEDTEKAFEKLHEMKQNQQKYSQYDTIEIHDYWIEKTYVYR